MKAWRIKHWDEHYEKGHRADREVIFHWVMLPTKHDGKSFRRVARRQLEGERAFCAWILMLQAAAKTPVRGILADLDGPFTAEDLSDKTGFSPECFEIGFKVLSDEKIDWIEEVDCPDMSGQVRTSPARGEKRRGEKKREQDIKHPTDVSAEAANSGSTPALDRPLGGKELAYPHFPVIASKRSSVTTWLLTDSHIAELVQTFPGVDVSAECRKACGWVKANLPKRKTMRGMPAFLFNWMCRCQNSFKPTNRGNNYADQRARKGDVEPASFG